MIRYLFLLMIGFPTIAYAQTEDAYSPSQSVVLEAATGKEMMKQCSRPTPQVKKFWNLGKTDTDSLEQHFNKLLAVKSSNGERIINLRTYAYQYLGVTIGKKKYIYINAFKINDEKFMEDRYQGWRAFPVNICDGGSMFWGVLFDLDSKQFSDLKFNGKG